MRPECVQSVEDELGRKLRNPEIVNIDDRVNEQMRVQARKDPEAWRKLSYSQQLKIAATEAAAQMKAEYAKKKQRVENQIAVHDRIENFLATQPDKMVGDAMRAVSRLFDFDTRSGGYTSVNSWARAIEAEHTGNLRDALEAVKGNFFGLFESKKGVHDLWHEMHGEDTGNPVAKAGAEAWRKVTDEMRDRYNAAGGNIGRLEDWGHTQHHSQMKVASAGHDAWASYIYPRLDRDKYVNRDGTRMSDQDVHDFLGHAYDSISTDGINKMTPGTNFAGSGLSLDRGAHRQIFFKDAQAHAEYNDRFGDYGLHDIMGAHVQGLSRDIALLERLGPNADFTAKYFNDRSLQDEVRQSPEKLPYLQKLHTFNEALYDAVAGRDQVIDRRVANAAQTFRNWMTATKLGRVVITALGDEAGMMSTAFANKVPYTSAFIREMMTLRKGEARNSAEEAGLGMDIMNHGFNKVAQDDFGAGFSGKVASSVLHLSGADRMWKARRQGLGTVIMSGLGRLTRELDSVNDLTKADHGMIAGKGTTEAIWQTWKRAQTEDQGVGAHSVLTPKAIWNIPNERLTDLGSPVALKREAVSHLLGHVLEEAGMGAMDTGPRQRIAVNLGTARGSYGGELWRSVNLFRSFAFSMMMKHWARAAQMPGVTGKIAYLAPLALYGTVIAAAGNQVRNMLSGQNPENMFTNGKDSAKFWGKALLRGGGLGIFGDFLYSESTAGNDNTLAATAGGPALSTLEDLWKLGPGALVKASEGKKTDEIGNLIKFARNNTPWLNMWYTGAAFDHLLWNNIQQAAAPGYLERLQQRQENEFGKSYYWKPTENLPSAMPNIKGAFGAKPSADFSGDTQ